jgi:hypothetical protein
VLAEGRGMTERVCKGCGGELPNMHGSRRYCSENCRKRWWDKRYRRPCADCGADIDAHGERCEACHLRRRRERHEALLAQVEKMFEAGMPARAIAVALGREPTHTSVPELTELREAGRIGYRYKAYEEKAA